ncbi:hypothetical protein R6Q59_028435 [Mikania micrantha]
MESNGVASYRHRRSPSSDRFLGVFSPPSSSGVISGGSSVAGDDFSEDDVFWTGDFAEQKRQSLDPVKGNNWSQNSNGNHQSFRLQDKFGILAALPEEYSLKSDRSVMNRRNPTIVSPTTANSSSSRLIPSIPRPNKHDRDLSHSMPLKFQQSAPVNVPIFTRKPRIGGELADVDIGEDDDEEMLPPHEIVARGSSNSPHTTFSVLEGAGRTLKGRDLRLVRNAVWRKTDNIFTPFRTWFWASGCNVHKIWSLILCSLVPFFLNGGVLTCFQPFGAIVQGQTPPITVRIHTP